jgi:chromosome partitioning protein
MNIITVASRKGGAGKTTICAHLAAHAQGLGHRTLVIDADPQGSLALCNALRSHALPLMTAERGIDRALALAMIDGIEWVFIDTAPTMWVVVQEAVRAATLVLIPARPGFLDLSAVRETVKCARERDKPYAVVLNACPVKRGQKEAPAVANSRAWLEKNKIPVWSGQVSQRAGFVLSLSKGAGAGEDDARSLGAAEITKLWSAVEKSVEAVNAARAVVVQAGRAA